MGLPNSTPELAAMSRPGRARYRATEMARGKQTFGKERWHREESTSPFYGRGFLLPCYVLPCYLEQGGSHA